MTCLYGGEFIGDGTPAEVFANPRVREVYLGSDVIDTSTVQAVIEEEDVR
jgi:ABC-type lipopolysaccharide export system ATPase subunit